MEFETIKTSKLYKTSTRKKRIYSAFQSLNLVQQPISSISEESKEKLKKIHELEEEQEQKSEDIQEEQDTEEDPFEISDNSDIDSTEEEDSFETEDTTVSDEEEVTSSEEAYSRDEDIYNEMQSIKGMLNSREDTAGVSYIQRKEKSDNDELWLYYKDDINLNSVMGNVIELLNATNYRYLQFNRLARSQNAIVFVILPDGIHDDLKSIKEIKEDIIEINNETTNQPEDEKVDVSKDINEETE